MEATRSALKSLVETTFDSVEGYRKAAETAKSPQLKAVLTQQAQKRQSTLDALNQELVRVGGHAVTSGTTAGGLHRLWADIQLVLSGQERFGYAPLETMSVKIPYNPDKDVEIYNGEGDLMLLTPGRFGILLPQDAHLPMCAVSTPEPVVKIVFKVRLP